MAAVRHHNQVLASCTILTACHSIGLEGASFGEDANLDLALEELDLSDDTIAAWEGSLTSGALTKTKLPKEYRIALLEDFRVGNTSIGHMRVDTALACPGRAGTGASRYCLVVAKLSISKRQVVHTTL